jgi:hypothetical protein
MDISGIGVNHKKSNREGLKMKGLKELNIQELDDLSSRIDRRPDETALVLFPERPDNQLELIGLIGEWAAYQKLALENTASGRPDLALIFKKSALRIWRQLPDCVQNLKISKKPGPKGPASG